MIFTRAIVLTLADVIDLDHNCIQACCLAHRRPVFTGGIDRDWLHSSRWPCEVRPPRLRVGSLCSGYSGLDLAVQPVLGGELAWVADNDPGASAILAHRFPGTPNLGDITAVDWPAVVPVDVLCAGFPCQDVSAAGKRAGLVRGSRSGLWHVIATAIGALRPGMVVIENTRGLLTARGDEPTREHLAAEAARDASARLLTWLASAENVAAARGDRDDIRKIRARTARVVGARKRLLARCQWHERRLVRAIGTVLGSLAGLGYDAQWVTVPASAIGAPHRRERVFVLAWPADARRDGLEGRQRDDPLVIEAAPGIGRRPAGGGEQAAADAPSADARRGRGSRPSWPHPESGAPGRSQPQPDDGGVELAADPGRDARAQDHPDGAAAAGRGGEPAEDADGSARGERRLPAPGQAQSGRARADAGGPGGAPASDSEVRGLERGRPERAGQGRWPEPGERAVPDAAGDGRDEGRPEPAGIVGRPDAAVRGHEFAADSERGGRDRRSPEPQRGPGERTAAAGGGEGTGLGNAAADPDINGRERREERDRASQRPEADYPDRRVDPLRRVLDWGIYEAAIRRWESVLGRSAPSPTVPGRGGVPRLNPAFAEWMMGLPEGWVTSVPGLSRNDMLRAIGNGVVPQQAAYALRLLLDAVRDELAGAA